MKLVTGVSLPGHQPGQERVQHGQGRDHTEHSQFMGGDWVEMRAAHSESPWWRLCLLPGAKLQRGRGRRIPPWFPLQAFIICSRCSPATCQAGFRAPESLEGFLLDVKDSSFIRQRLTMWHALF